MRESKKGRNRRRSGEVRWNEGLVVLWTVKKRRENPATCNVQKCWGEGSGTVRPVNVKRSIRRVIRPRRIREHINVTSVGKVNRVKIVC